MTIQAGFQSFSRRNARLNGAKDLPKLTDFDAGDARNVAEVLTFNRRPAFTPKLSHLLANAKRTNLLPAAAWAFHSDPAGTYRGRC